MTKDCKLHLIGSKCSDCCY